MKRQNIIKIIITCVISAIIVGILFYPSSTPAIPLAIDTYATEESVSSLSDTMNNFSFELYKQLSSKNDENVFFSPYSIFVALAMTYEGASGQTAEEMHSVLGFSQNNETVLCSFGRIYNLLNQKKEYILNTANALWTQEDYSFLDDYLNFISNYYMGKATDVDFRNAEEASRLINQWIEKNTGGKIKNMISSTDIDPLTKLIITNAIYFKGDWKYKFDPKNTVDANFEISPGNNVSVPMMSIDGSNIALNYSDSEDLQILELPYKGDKLSMIVLLPKDNNISKLETTFGYENFSKWISSLAKTNVRVSFPKFKMETEYRLEEYLINMGMNAPFSSINADFSGMTGRKDLYIGSVIHKGFIEVNEEGTEAAGATSVNMITTSIPNMVEFNADHPFICVIQHKETGTILFMGKIVNPQ